jgi:hypothetical protein
MKVVRVISVDAESNLAACETYLNGLGVRLAARIPGEHEKYAERATRVVRERMRVKLLELPYTLPRPLHDSLASEVIRNMNLLPNSKSLPLNPKEMVVGDRVNFLTDLAPPFGVAGLAPIASRSDSSEQKQEVGVIMGASNAQKGGVRMYLLNKGNPLTRRNIKSMAMTDQIIEHMNDYAAESEMNRGKKYDSLGDNDEDDDFFQFRDTMIEGGEETRNEDFYRAGENSNPNFIVNPKGIKKTLVPISYDPRDEGGSGVISRDNPDVGWNKQSPVKSEEKNEDFTTSPIVSFENTYKDSASPLIHDKVDVVEESPSTTSTSTHSTPKKRPIREKGPERMTLRGGRVYQMTLSKALASEEAEAARQAAKKELSQLVNLKTWEYLKEKSSATPSVHTKETPPCSMFLKEKRDAKGQFLLWKARLVNGGHMTDPTRYDPFEKAAPTISLEVVMAQLAIAVRMKHQVESFDVPGAYLNSSLRPDRYHKMRISGKIAKLLMEVDPRSKQFVQQDGTILVEIRRSLYGLPEAAQLWYDYLSKALLDGGYRKCPVEPCLFMRTKGNGKQVSIVSVYVDDCLHIYSDEGIKREMYASLRNAKLDNLKISQLTLNEDISFLGLNIAVEKEEGFRFVVNQIGYLDTLLSIYDEELSAIKRNAVTPCSEDAFKPKDEGEDLDPTGVTEFLSKLMRVRYLIRTRPDIELAISILTTKSRSPTKGDNKRLNRVLTYLRGTRELGMNIRSAADIKMYAYIDAAYAVHPKMESHTGSIITIGRFGVSLQYKSLKQKLVTTSSTEAELVAIYEVLDFVLWMRKVLEFLGYPQETTTIFQDNTSTITMAHMGRGSSGSHTRHIDVKYFWIKQFIEDKTFVIEHLFTDNMLADFFASPRQGQTFRKFRDIIMGRVL